MKEQEPYTTKEIARLTRRDANTVARWRRENRGPPWYELEGKILYDVKEFEAWRRKEREREKEK